MNLTSCEYVYNNTDVYNKLQKFQYVYVCVCVCVCVCGTK